MDMETDAKDTEVLSAAEAPVTNGGDESTMAVSPLAHLAASTASGSKKTLSYPRVYHVVKGHAGEGHLKFAASGLAFKNKHTGKVMQVGQPELVSARWMRVARGFQLRLGLKTGSSLTFDGFDNSDKDELHDYLRSILKLEIEEVEPSVKGFNWGVPMFTEAMMAFIVDGGPAFEIPLRDVANANGNKNEATLEFFMVCVRRT